MDVTPLVTTAELLNNIREWHEHEFKSDPQYRYSNYVNGEGVAPAKIMVVGSAPNTDEHIARRPFVGVSGRVLRQMMALSGIHEPVRLAWPPSPQPCVDAWLTTAFKFRPPRGRHVTYGETIKIRQPLRNEWKAIGRPKIIMPVGTVALYAVTGQRLSMMSTAGKPFPMQDSFGNDLIIYPMLHPSYALELESARPLLEQHWDEFAIWYAQQH